MVYTIRIHLADADAEKCLKAIEAVLTHTTMGYEICREDEAIPAQAQR